MKTQISVRWSDIDPNFHLRHSTYYDFAAQMRTEVLMQMGITMEKMEEAHFSPVLFREECIFRNEIRFGDNIFLTLKMTRLRKDFTHFSMQHEFLREDGTLCAVINIDAGWVDTRKRKLTPPPAIAQEALFSLPKTENFAWEEVYPVA